jgi:hypothetical protein
MLSKSGSKHHAETPFSWMARNCVRVMSVGCELGGNWRCQAVVRSQTFMTVQGDREPTLSTDVARPGGFVDGIHPTLFDAVQPAFAFKLLLPAQVQRSFVVRQGNAATSPGYDDKPEYDEGDEEKEQAGEQDQERQQHGQGLVVGLHDADGSRSISPRQGDHIGSRTDFRSVLRAKAGSDLV